MNYQKHLSTIDKSYIWHPFTQMKDWVAEDPLIIQQGNGSYLYDVKGNRYIDGVSSLWVNIHGHRNKELNRAIKNQLNKIAHSTLLGLTHEPAIRLAEQLIAIAPNGIRRVFYSDNGSTAVEVALKIAYQYWQQKKNPRPLKTKYVALTDAYHGDTLGSVSVGGIARFHKIFHPLLFHVYRAPAPYCYRCSFNSHGNNCTMYCIEAMEKIMKVYHKTIAACVIEPMIQGAAGMIAFPKGYTKAVEKLCRKYNILLICDEVATGFGRTGKMFAGEHEAVKPDILCVAKGITGGYLPLAATLTTEEIYKAFLGPYEKYRTFFHGHSYTANPLACAAALANIRLFKKEKVLNRLQSKIEILKDELKKISLLPGVGDVRQCGFMAGIEMVKDNTSKKPFPVQQKIGVRICTEARKQGLIIRPLGDVIVIMPPLTISARLLKRMLSIIRRCISFKERI